MNRFVRQSTKFVTKVHVVRLERRKQIVSHLYMCFKRVIIHLNKLSTLTHFFKQVNLCTVLYHRPILIHNLYLHVENSIRITRIERIHPFLHLVTRQFNVHIHQLRIHLLHFLLQNWHHPFVFTLNKCSEVNRQLRCLLLIFEYVLHLLFSSTMGLFLNAPLLLMLQLIPLFLLLLLWLLVSWCQVII